MATPVRGVYEKVQGSGIWWIRWTDAQGKLHREKAGRRGDAQALVEKRRTLTLQTQKLPEQFRPKVSFGSLLDDVLEHSRVTNNVKVTYDLTTKVDRLRKVFGDRDATSITRQEITRWLTAQSDERSWKPSTLNRWQAGFSLTFRVGMENGKVEANPAAGIRRTKEDNARKLFLSQEEELRLRRVIRTRFPEFLPQLDVSLHTGMRAGEQFSLDWSQVDFERRILSLYKTKNGSTRHIPLNAVALAALQTLRTGSSESKVFPSARKAGEGLQGARGWFKSALKDAAIENYTWHCNRHTFASRLVMAGVDIRTVGELLGHKSLTMTLRYSHLAPAHNAAAVDRLVTSVESQLTPELTPAF